MRAPLVAVALLLVSCGRSTRHDAAAVADAGATARAPSPGCIDALAAAPVTGSLDRGLGRVLDQCTPCGISWQPLIAASAFDPEDPPDDLPSSADIFAVLDACKATCQSSSRAAVSGMMIPSAYAGTPSAPWRAIAEKCTGALHVDDHTRRFARGTWYALDQIARAYPDTAAEFPLPPLTQASTAFALPRTDAITGIDARLHVTVIDKQVFVGVLPWVSLAGGVPALVPGSGLDYPGDPVELADLAAKIVAIQGELATSKHAADRASRPVLIAPRGLPLARLVEVTAKLPTQVYLGVTPASRTTSAWPEPLGVIPVLFAASPGGTTVPTIDVSARGQPIAARVAAAPLPAGVTEVHLVLPATAQAADLAYALAALAPRGVTAANITLSP